MSRSILRTLLAAWCTLGLAAAKAGDWPQFRGPQGNGISSEKNVPQEWSKDKNIAWRAELPGPGNSSPIVVRDRVFITVATENGKFRHLHCYDRKSGKRLWVRTVQFDGREPTHSTSPYCCSTPCSDGQRVVVWHSSAGMYCYDMEGKELWKIDLGPFIHIWGYGASPIIYQDLVINNCGPGERTFLVALHKYTGEKVWQTDEPGGHSGEVKEGEARNWIGSWSTPVLAKVRDQDQLIVSYPKNVKAYDPRTGEVLWQCDGLGPLVYTTALVEGELGVALSGYHGPCMGFKLGGKGNVTEQNQLWRQAERQPQRIGSGILLDKYLYMANEDGTVQCNEATTGKELWKQRLEAQGNLWSSLILAEGRFYVTTKRGETAVFAATPEKCEPIRVNSLGEPSDSTIAISDGQLFLRTFQALYCIEEK